MQMQLADQNSAGNGVPDITMCDKCFYLAI
jgi:hypothetical protein